ncbi:recombinase family protein [Sphingopyxis sp. J-6]|uniref:recombinase family protein n=1 Tax=Sphingopyxis sp. J-6 TaxID=3122054 RepID=UPI003984114F
MRTLIYARFSSTLQNSRSIDDQVAVCRARCEAEGWEILGVYPDYAIGGGAGFDESQRPQMAALLARVDQGGIEQVLADTTSRIARNLGDATQIRERINFAGARLFTLADGEVDALRGGIKGVIDEHQRKENAHNIRRGQRGRAQQGFAPAGKAYGYALDNRIDEATGRALRGRRRIDPEQAAVIRRIFAEYAAGRSARQIAESLNADRVAPPSGKYWAVNTINGSNKRGDGILRNRLYKGEMVVGRTRKVVDPVTRKVRIRAQPESEWQVSAVPDLRIVDEDIWQAAQAQRMTLSAMPVRATVRPVRLLSGRVRCGACGGTVVIIQRNRWGCRSTREHGDSVCTMRRTVSNEELEARVMTGLTTKLLHPDVVAEHVRTVRSDYARAAREASDREAGLRSRVADAEKRIANLIAAIESGAGEFADIRQALAKATAERDDLRAGLAEIDSENVIALHPTIADDYRRMVADLSAVLATPEGAIDLAPVLRNLIDHVTIRPGSGKKDVEIELVGRLANLVAMARGTPVTANAPVFTMTGERVKGIEPSS